MSDYLLVMTTLDSAEAARSLARVLVERRLVACVNVVPNVLSVYRWQGAIEEEAEYLLLMKTRRDGFDALSAAVSEIHSYDVPELIALPVERGAAAYLAWIDASLGGEPRDANE